MTRFLVYTDASSRYKAAIVTDKQGQSRRIFHSSIGAVIKNGSDELVGTISKTVGWQNSNYAEFLAMHAVLRYLLDNGIKSVEFKTDCMNLVLMIKHGIMSEIEQLRKISYSILSMLQELNSWTVDWIDRKYNKEAHRQAAKAFSRKLG
jgi:ribonuclease HI